MKKLLLSVLVSISAFAADHNLYNNSAYVMGGFAINSAQSRLSNDFYWGVRYNFNRATVEGSIDVDAIQIAMDYTGDNIFQNPSKGIVDGKTGIYRLGVNALWYIENDSDYTPFISAGVGAQLFSNSAARDDNNALFAAIGGGVEYQLRGDFSVVGEIKDIYAGEKDTYVTTGIGIKYSFGQNY